MVAISGFSGVGKDECAGHLVRKYRAIQTGLADPAKRHMMDVYGFTVEQLWGPSHMRNSGDPRYPKNVLNDLGPVPQGMGESILSRLGPDAIHGEIKAGKGYVAVMAPELPGSGPVPAKPGWGPVPWTAAPGGSRIFFIEEDHPNFFLSPREALQLYCNLLNDLHLNTWARKGVEIQKALSKTLWDCGYYSFLPRYTYSREIGLSERVMDVDDIMSRKNVGVSAENPDGEVRYHENPFVTTFSDFRHRHEIRLAREMANGYVPVMVRVKHPKIEKAPYDHRSETEQEGIPDSAFDFVVRNDGTLEDLRSKMDDVVQAFSTPEWEPLPAGTPLS